jgi:putative ABC transport system permease protein
VVLLFALAVSVAAMGAVAFFTDRVRQAVSQQANEALAADLRLESVAPISESYADRARRRGLATARVTHFRSVIAHGRASSLADVRGVSGGYPLRGEVRVAERLAGPPRAADGVPGRGEAWAEPSLMARLGVKVGDRIRVGGLLVRITRTLEFRPDEGWRLMELAPTVLLNLEDLGASGLIQPGSIVEYELLFAGGESQVASFKNELQPLLTAEERLEDYRDARPEVRASVRRAERFLILSAMVSVLLGGVAVAMAARRFVARRLDAVAVMKCLGARHRDILALSLVQLTLLVLIAAALGSVAGFLAQLGLGELLSGLVETRLPPPGLRGLVIGPVTAVTVALGFALPPLLRLKNVPPARVLRHDLEPPPLGYSAVYGAAAAGVAGLLYWLFGDVELVAYLIGGAAVTFAGLYLAGRLLVLALQGFRGSAGIAWRYGIANVARRGRESSVQVVAFGIGLMVLLLLTVVRTQLMTEWQTSLPEGAPNHFVINVQPGERETVTRVLREDGIGAPAFTPLARARITRVNGQSVDAYHAKDRRAEHELHDDVNLTWMETLGPDNEIVSGRWWQPGDTAAQLSVEQDMLKEMGLKLGDELTYTVAGESVTVRITSTRRVHWDSFRPNFFMVVNPGVLDELPHTYVTSFYVPASRRDVVLDIVRELPGVSVIDIGAVLDQVRRGMDQASLAVQYVFLFTVAAGLMVLMAAIQATRDERLYESAVLRTLGAKRSTILQGVAVEFVALGVLAGTLAASGAALAGYFLASRLFNLQYLPGPALWLAGLAAGAAIVGASGTFAVRSVVNETPVSTLRRV